MPVARQPRRPTAPARPRGRSIARVALLTLAATAIALLAAGCGGGGKPSVEKLTWLSGCWSGKSDGVRIDEQWNKPGGGSLQGTSRRVKDGKTVFDEYRRIEQTDGGLRLVLLPSGREGASYRLSDSGRSDVIFTNEAQEFPRRIIYHRRGSTLFVRAEGLEAGRKVEQKYRLKRATCE